ncbi:MAG: hypothetical protein J6X44_05030 [Thermoguttaceae bacterium]|nr:hypothetical protein [Thermoguttaceae bacterium]
MTIGGWISMTITLGFVIGLFGWCCYKMTTAPETLEENLADTIEGVETGEIAQSDEN